MQDTKSHLNKLIRISSLMAVLLILSLTLPMASATLGTNWGCSEHDISKTGACDTIPLSTHYVAWSTETTSFSAERVVCYNGSIYLLDSGEGGGMSCYSGQTGGLQWTFSHEANHVITSDAIAVDGKLYFGTYDALYCIDAITGAKIWESPTSVHNMYATPAYADGVVYCADTRDDFAFNASTGINIWVQPLIGTMNALTVADGRIFYIANGGLYILNCTDGSSLAFTPVSSNGEDGAPTIYNHMVYVIANAVDGVNPGIVAFDESGNALWNTTVPGADTYATVSADNGMVFVGGVSGVEAISIATHQTEWYSVADSNFTYFNQSPIVANGVVYITSSSLHGLYAFSETDGSQLWYVNATDGYGSTSVPASANGMVYFVDNSVNTVLYGIGTYVAYAAPTPTPTPHGGGGGGGDTGSQATPTPVYSNPTPAPSGSWTDKIPVIGGTIKTVGDFWKSLPGIAQTLITVLLFLMMFVLVATAVSRKQKSMKKPKTRRGKHI